MAEVVALIGGSDYVSGGIGGGGDDRGSLWTW